MMIKRHSPQRRVAIVGADFSPSSLPPALRIRFFARHLREFGWDPVVITTNPQYYDWPVDPENERLVPGDVEIIRTSAWSGRWARKVGVGDIGLRSLWHHARALVRECRRGQVDLVFIPVPPFYSMLLGRLIHELTGVPYVIDYIDPWVTDFLPGRPEAGRFSKKGWARLLARALEPIALKKVSHLTAVAESYLENVVERYPWIDRSATSGIPYGGEPADLDYLRTHPRANPHFDRADGLFHLCHVGRAGDDMQRPLRAVLEAIRSGLDLWPDQFSRLRLHFIGTSYAPHTAAQQVLPLAEQYGLTGCVTEHPGRVPYLDALQILLDSHALLAVGSEARHYTASKIFPCILAARPLLALFHSASTVVQVLRETGAGQLVCFDEHSPPASKTTCLRDALLQLLVSGDRVEVNTNWAAFEGYTTRATARRLSQVFDTVVGRRPPAAPEPRGIRGRRERKVTAG